MLMLTQRHNHIEHPQHHANRTRNSSINKIHVVKILFNIPKHLVYEITLLVALLYDGSRYCHINTNHYTLFGTMFADYKKTVPKKILSAAPDDIGLRSFINRKVN